MRPAPARRTAAAADRQASTPATPAQDALHPATRLLATLLALLGLSALGGGLTMVLAPDGGLIGMDPEMLDRVPLIDDWLVPGLFLAGVLGLGGLLTAVGILRRRSMAWAGPLEQATQRRATWWAALAIGVVLALFIAYEAVIVTAPEGRWLQWTMGLVGLAIAGLCLTAQVQADLAAPPPPHPPTAGAQGRLHPGGP